MAEIKQVKIGSTTYDIKDTNALPKSGGNINGHIYLTGAQANSSTANTSQIIFGTSDNHHVAISSNNNALVINPDSSSTTHQIVLYLDKASMFPSGIQGNLTGIASKATADASGNTITSTYETKANATSKLEEAKAYTDAAITWGSW